MYYKSDYSIGYDGRTNRKGFQLAQISNRPKLNIASYKSNQTSPSSKIRIHDLID